MLFRKFTCNLKNGSHLRILILTTLILLVAGGGIYFWIINGRDFPPSSCIGSTKPREKICKEGKCKLIVSDSATCVNIDENKNRLTVIVRKNGIYDTEIFKQKITFFLNSVKSDLNVKNIGISYFAGDSKEDLDAFIENLYCQKNVGYVILLGDNFIDFLQSKDPIAYNYWHYELSLVGKGRYTYENGEEEPNPDSVCKDVAISVISPPVKYNSQEKKDFVMRVIDNYINYHNNKNNILSKFQGHLHIQWDSVKLGGEEFLKDPPEGYITENTVLTYNTNHSEIIEELNKKPYLLSFHFHGSPTVISMGLSPDLENDQSGPVWTTLSEFRQYISQNKNFPLIVDIGNVCGTGELLWKDVDYCCWPQAFLEAGVWASFIMSGTPHEINPFIGYKIRHKEMDNYYIYGDITAHLNE